MNIVKNIILIIIFKVFDFIFQTIKAIKYNNFNINKFYFLKLIFNIYEFINYFNTNIVTQI